MNAGLIAFSSGVLGLALGLLSMGILRRFERERHRTTVAEPALSDGAAQVLAVIGRPAKACTTPPTSSTTT